jgi:hypothetical protein
LAKPSFVNTIQSFECVDSPIHGYSVHFTLTRRDLEFKPNQNR